MIFAEKLGRYFYEYVFEPQSENLIIPTDAQERNISQLEFSIQDIYSGKDGNYLIENVIKLLGSKEVLDFKADNRQDIIRTCLVGSYI